MTLFIIRKNLPSAERHEAAAELLQFRTCNGTLETGRPPSAAIAATLWLLRFLGPQASSLNAGRPAIGNKREPSTMLQLCLTVARLVDRLTSVIPVA